MTGKIYVASGLTAAVTDTTPGSPGPTQLIDAALLALGGVLVTSDLAIVLGVPGAGLGPLPVRSLQAVLALTVAGLVVVRGGLTNPLYAVVGSLTVPVAVLYGFTGLLLPWDQLSFWLAQSVLETLLLVPVLGESIATALFGGLTIGRATLQLAWLYHNALVGALAVGLLVHGGALVYRRGGSGESDQPASGA